MRVPKILYPFLAITFYFCVMVLYAHKVNAMGLDLVNKAEDITEIENGYISPLEEDNEDNGAVLYDIVGSIEEINEDMEGEEGYSQDHTDFEDGDSFSADSLQSEEVMNEDQYRIMVVFCFGLCAGIIVGHFLTGFIK